MHGTPNLSELNITTRDRQGNHVSIFLVFAEIEADFLVPLKDQKAKENSTVEFECTLTTPTKPEKVHWFIDGKEVDTSDKSRFEAVTVNDKLRLVIHAVTMEDAGEVTVKVGDKDSTAKLTVQGGMGSLFRSSKTF